MCKNAGLLAGFDHQNRRILMRRANCDNWQCEECAKRLKDHWQLRASIGTSRLMADGVRMTFVTITSHERLKDFAACEAVWRVAWHTLYQAYKRQNSPFEYLMIPERHKDGRMHMHGIWSGNVTKRWLKDKARSSGLGFMADVSPLTEPIYAVRYVTKYLSKDLGRDVPSHFRRVRVSQGWADIPKPNNDLSALEWKYIGGNGALYFLYKDAKYIDYRLIDLETGELFDDIDLGTIAAV